MTDKKFIKGLIIGVLIAIAVMWYRNRVKTENSGETIPEPIPDKKPEPQPITEDRQIIGFNETDDDLREFEENCNEIANIKYFAEVGAADDYFFRVAEGLDENTDNIFYENAVNKTFIRNFNIMYARCRGKKDFRQVSGSDCGDEGIRKGDKATEANMLKHTFNILAETNLQEDGNYNKKLFFTADELLKGTSVYNETDGGFIPSCFIKNLYYLIINLKK